MKAAKKKRGKMRKQHSVWGFGCAPFKPATLDAYTKALSQLMMYIYHQELAAGISITDEASIVKGMFNRIKRQDQWDWFTVNMFFDYPQREEIPHIVDALIALRTSIINMDSVQQEKARDMLIGSNFPIYATNFLEYKQDAPASDAYVYILSRREEKELLNIGATSQNVIKRVEEINNAEGVLYPLSPRNVFRVTDGMRAKELVHQVLAGFRVRDDKEYFVLPYWRACEKIDACLRENDLYYNKYNVDNILNHSTNSLNEVKAAGFLESFDEEDDL
jgi:hypothetical protein